MHILEEKKKAIGMIRSDIFPLYTSIDFNRHDHMLIF